MKHPTLWEQIRPWFYGLLVVALYGTGFGLTLGLCERWDIGQTTPVVDMDEPNADAAMAALFWPIGLPAVLTMYALETDR